MRTKIRTKIRRRKTRAGVRWYVFSMDPEGREIPDGHGGYAMVREAKAAAKALEVDSSRGSYVEPSRMTVSDGYTEWSATRKNLSPNAQSVEGIMWSSWILPTVGAVPVQRFTQRDYHRMDDALIVRGLSGKSRRNARGTLRTFFSWALENGYVLRNVVALTDPPSIDDSKAREAFTPDEVRALLAVPDRLYPVWRLFFESGARRGEIAGLQDDDVDSCRVHIRRQALVRPARAWDQDRVYIRPTTKSRRERTVVVSEEMGAILRRWRMTRAGERLEFGPAYRDEGWIVAEPDGSLIQPDTLTARFRALEKKAGVPHRGLHACRHTHAEMALASGVRLDIVSKQLGHASVAITADVYGHPDEEALEEAARRIGEVLG
jgi:integrase